MPPIRYLNALAVLCCGVSVALVSETAAKKPSLMSPTDRQIWRTVDCEIFGDKYGQRRVRNLQLNTDISFVKDTTRISKYEGVPILKNLNRKTVGKGNAHRGLEVREDLDSKKVFVVKSDSNAVRVCRETRAYVANFEFQSTAGFLGAMDWLHGLDDNNHNLYGDIRGVAVELLGDNLKDLYDKGVTDKKKALEEQNAQMLVLSMFLSCAKALQNFHKSGLTHLDVTLENFVTTNDKDHTTIREKPLEEFESRMIDFEHSRTPAELQSLQDAHVYKPEYGIYVVPVKEEVRKLGPQTTSQNFKRVFGLRSDETFVPPEVRNYKVDPVDRFMKHNTYVERKLVTQSADIYSLGMQFKRISTSHYVKGLGDTIAKCIKNKPNERISDDQLVKELSKLRSDECVKIEGDDKKIELGCGDLIPEKKSEATASQ